MKHETQRLLMLSFSLLLIVNHKNYFLDRKSKIYQNQPDFCIFGVGYYSFSPFKIAISGLYKKLNFNLILPYQNQPVIFDDTVYFLSFDDLDTAQKTLQLLNSSLGKELRTLAGHSKGVWSVVYSPDGRYLASGSSDKTIKIWEVATGKELRTLTGHSSGVLSVVYSPDGRYLASGSADKTIKIWEVAKGKELRTLTGHSHSVKSVVYSPDGRYLASGSGDKTIKIWRVGQ